jgi:ferredoxin-NADP reductase
MNEITKIIAVFNQQLGRISMYRLVLFCLSAMIGTALTLMAVGELGYSPLWFAVTVAVITLSALGSNYLFAWLFGVKAHGESAVITGFILSLLFLPQMAVAGLVKVGLVAVIAMASKYIIAIRNRHIFNPAAIAIVIASLGGLAYAGWWIATPGMIPVTLLAALLILHRTGKLRMGIVFVGVAMGALFLQGTDPVIALTSWPLLFVAGVMLSEPLTMPPRAKQQFAVAILVAVLMTVPFSYGRVTMTPALAIILGNLVGWWFSQRRDIKLRFAGKKQMGASTFEFTFDSPKLKFEPGQYLELTLIHPKGDMRGYRRIFSIASKPGDDQVVIGTKIFAKPSSFKQALMELKPGATVHATRIAGDFVLPKDPKRPIVCIAGGIGITPFVSFVMSSDRSIQLIYSVREASELSFVDTLKQHNIDVTVVSGSETKLPDRDWKHEVGRIDQAMLKKLIDVDAQPVVYISGPPAMIVNLRQAVKNIGIRDVKVDEFSGY